MKLRITGCKDPQMWYADQIGETFNWNRHHWHSEIRGFNGKIRVDSVYYVKDKEGFTNIVKKEDCRIILEHVSHN